MGTVHAEITLSNVFDEKNVQEGIFKEQELPSMTVTAVVDTGAASLVINHGPDGEPCCPGISGRSR